jgi:hypothetical protein
MTTFFVILFFLLLIFSDQKKKKKQRSHSYKKNAQKLPAKPTAAVQAPLAIKAPQPHPSSEPLDLSLYLPPSSLFSIWKPQAFMQAEMKLSSLEPSASILEMRRVIHFNNW